MNLEDADRKRGNCLLSFLERWRVLSAFFGQRCLFDSNARLGWEGFGNIPSLNVEFELNLFSKRKCR